MPLTISRIARTAVGVAVAALLAGCVASQPGIVPAERTAGAVAGALQQHDLLYAANGNGTVSVYRYWQHTLAFILTDFKKPMGACADRSGHVYITDYQRQKIYEYAHGGKKPIATLDDSPFKPFACSVSPPNGDLAVANSPYESYSNGGGNIAIYPHGTGKPILLPSGGSKGVHFTGCAYDDHGDLLAMNEYRYSSYWELGFYYLPKNGTKLLPMRLPGMGYSSTDFGVVQGIAWDGKYWLVGPIYNEVFLYTINIKAYQVGTVKLTDGQRSFGPVAIYGKTRTSQGTQLVAGAGTVVDFFKYPAGGAPIAQISKDLDAPFGVAISLRTQP